jgi:hypothetical protein
MIIDYFKKYINTKKELFTPLKIVNNKKSQATEHFNHYDYCDYYNPVSLTLYFIISCFAVYLSWRCNKQFNFIQLLFALIVPEIYIIYQIAVSGMCGIL